MLSVSLLFNARTGLYETWYLYHGTCVHLNGVLHTSLPLFCVFIHVSPIFARQRLAKNVAGTTNTQEKKIELLDLVIFYAVRVVSKESRVLIISRNSCPKCLSYWNSRSYNGSAFKTCGNRAQRAKAGHGTAADSVTNGIDQC
jgi:hypothetical protein